MAEEKAGFVGWKIGQEPNVVATCIGFFCCCFLGLYNFHLFLEEAEKELGFDASDHWLNVIIGILGFYKLEKHLGKLETKLNITPNDPIPLIACILCGLAWPFKMCNLMKRANVIKAAQANAAE